MWHLIEGEAGCAYAVENHCVAVIVDALRASATAAMLFEAGAAEIIVLRQVADAFAAKRTYPDALLFGERSGLPPEGFDYGNSPRSVRAAEGKRVIFTTTTGAQRLVAAWGAAAVYMGTTINAEAVAAAVASHGAGVVLIPAGLSGDPGFNAQEDWVAATLIAMQGEARIGEGAGQYGYWRERIEAEGLDALFDSAPHAAKLRRVGLGEDVAFCAQVNIVNRVPEAVARIVNGVIVRESRA